MTAPTIQETLAALSTEQLKKLEFILVRMDRTANVSFDELLSQLASPQSTLSKANAELIAARSYEISLTGMDFKLAKVVAREEFESRKLQDHCTFGIWRTRPPSIPRYKPQSQTTGAPSRSQSLGAPVVPASTVLPSSVTQAHPIPETPQPLPDNVVVLKPKPPAAPSPFHSKFFHSTHGNTDNDVW